MNDINIFDKEGIEKVTYGKFKCTYIPIINKNIICNSIYLDNYKTLRGSIQKKIFAMITQFTITNIFYKEIIETSLNKEVLEELKKIQGYSYSSIYIGMEQITKRYTIQLMDTNGKILAYAKIPKTKEGYKCIDKEIKNLNYINKLNLKYAKIPEVLLFNKENYIFIESTKENLKNDKGKINMKHINFLSELYQETNKAYKFKESEVYKHLINIEKETDNEELINLAKDTLNSINIKEIQYSYSHGDFYFANIKEYKDILYIYDFESSKYYPSYYDLFNYITKQKLLKKRYSKHKVLKDILKNNRYINDFENKNKLDKMQRKEMLIIYLYEIIYEYAISLNLDIKKDNTLKSYIKALKILTKK